jgi:hypothetical protein
MHFGVSLRTRHSSVLRLPDADAQIADQRTRHVLAEAIAHDDAQHVRVLDAQGHAICRNQPPVRSQALR